MASASSETDTQLGQTKIVSDDILFYFELIGSVLVTALLSVLGVATNIINVVVYWKQGFVDSVNITFIALSCWDLISCFMSCLSVVCDVLEIYFPLPAINTISLQYVYFGYTRGCVYVLSTLVTVYLSVERSICIMLPFKVKNIFTTARVVLVNWNIVMFGLACYCPAWATQGMQWLCDPETNRSRWDLWLSVNRRDIDLFVDTFTGLMLPASAQLLITVNAGFMIYGISKSVKFRNQAFNLGKHESITGSTNGHFSNSDTPKTPKSKKMMSSKTLKLTKVVVLLAVMFFACNIPVVLVAFLRAAIPELDVGKSQYNLYRVLYAVVYHCGLINSSVHIFIYYNVSTKYRQEFLTLFGLSGSRENNAKMFSSFHV